MRSARLTKYQSFWQPGMFWLFFMILIWILPSFSKVEIIRPRQQHPTSFAIVVDAETYRQIGPAVDAYRDAVEDDGLSAYVISDNWQSPEQIRELLIGLADNKPPLEGAVFIGDIPVPMIRDAQHMSSAFKMNQDESGRFPWVRSSIPSDRYYDDFDLNFKFLKQDSLNPLLFYYSLTADSPQKIERDIYSGRVKPAVNDDRKYALIEKFLRKAIAAKKSPEMLDNMMVTTGHGYYSESLNAWSGEIVALKEQFPRLYQSGGTIKTLYHAMGTDLKEQVLQLLQQPDLDIALFHAHGNPELQYLLGAPPAENVNQQIEAIKYFLRSKLRQAKRRRQSLEKTKQYYMDNYGVSEAWFAGAFDDSVMAADTLAEYNVDLHVQDIRKIAPQAEFVMFDECFNGAFINSPYIAGEYIFGDGATVAGVANTVNVLQDLWADEHLGLLGYGVRVGEWHRSRNYLESHIIGDPTFHFKNPGKLELNKMLALNDENRGDWEKLLKNGSPALRSVALERLYKIKKEKFENKLIEIYKNDPAGVVRMQALKCLAELRSPSFENILLTSINDPYELIRRFTARWMGDVGKQEYLPALVNDIIWDPAKRTNYAVKDAITKIGDTEGARIAAEALQAVSDTLLRKKFQKQFEGAASYNSEWLNKELMPTIQNDTLSLKKRIAAVRTFRNYRFQEALPSLISFALSEDQPPALRATILETLGWFGFSHDRHKISFACESIIKQHGVPQEVKAEALKTLNRIKAGANNPLTP